MNFKINHKIINFSLALVFALFGLACQTQTFTQQGGNARTPTEAYKMLYAAVKAKDTEKIKQMMTKDTQGIADLMAARYKQPIEKSYENGLTATTITDAPPEIRDERVKDNFGAVEVYNQKEKRWEDLPFIKDETGWKLAFGELTNGKYKSPGKGRAQIEQEAANPLGNNMIPMMPNTNSNFPTNSKVKTVEVPLENKPKK